MTDDLQADIDQLLAFIAEIAPDVSGACTPEADLERDVGMTSIQVLDLVERIEDTFDVVFPLNDLADIRTVRDLATYLQRIRKS